MSSEPREQGTPPDWLPILLMVPTGFSLAILTIAFPTVPWWVWALVLLGVAFWISTCRQLRRKADEQEEPPNMMGKEP